MGILETNNVSLQLNGTQILKNMSIDIWEGHIHAIVGPNGAGKSSLASTIMGLPAYRKAEGTILFQGEEIQDLEIDERARKGLTFAWQEPARFEGLSVPHFVLAGSQQKNGSKLRKVLSDVGLNPAAYIKRKVDSTLSGGERKKIELASILAIEPKLLLLDELDSGIDIGTLENIFEIIKGLKEKGITIVLITHSLPVLRQADHAFLMCHGEILDKGKAEKIIPYFENNCIPCPHKNLPIEDGGIHAAHIS
jgi:Fe-S cluster assembly ATP-binding protein